MRTIGAAAAAGEVGSAERGIGKLGETAKQAAGVAGLAGLAFGIKDITQAAMTFATQQGQLAQALRNTGQYSTQNLKELVDYSDALSTHGGLDPSSTLSGVQRLIAAHDSVTQAMKDETLAQDVYRSGQTSYTSALRAVMNIEQGRTTGLSRLGVQIQPVKTAEDALAQARLNHANALKTLTAEGIKMTSQQRAQYELNNQITPQMIAQAKAQDQQATKTEALRVLWGRFGGQVQAFSHGPQGAISNFKNSIDVLAQRLGTFLLPVITGLAHGLTAVANIMGTVTDYFVKNHAAAIALRDVVTGLAIAWAAWKLGILETIAGLLTLNATEAALVVVTGAQAAATWALNAAMAVLDAMPIVLALTAIIAVIVLLIYHFKAVKAAVIDAWHWMEQAAKDSFGWTKGAVADLVNWIGQHWKMLAVGGAFFLGGPFLALPVLIATHLNRSKTIIIGIVNWIGGAARAIGEAMASAFKASLNFIIGLVNTAISGVNHLIDLIPNPGDWFGASIPHIPQIPHLWTGGTVTRGGMVIVGEKGPEPILLPAGAQVFPHAPTTGRDATRDGWPLEATLIWELDGRQFARAVTRAYATQKASS